MDSFLFWIRSRGLQLKAFGAMFRIQKVKVLKCHISNITTLLTTILPSCCRCQSWIRHFDLARSRFKRRFVEQLCGCFGIKRKRAVIVRATQQTQLRRHLYPSGNACLEMHVHETSPSTQIAGNIPAPLFIADFIGCGQAAAINILLLQVRQGNALLRRSPGSRCSYAVYLAIGL